MANTTQLRVIAIAPELADVSADAWDMVLTDVAGMISSAIYGTSQERAQRYLAAHFLTIIKEDPLRRPDAAGPVSSDSAGQITTNYAVMPYKDRSRYDETVYGRQFMQIRRENIIPVMVYTP